jgi:hypothetical protein
MKRTVCYLFYKRIAVAVVALAAGNLAAQNNVSINATGAVAHPSAMLDVSGTSGGVLAPRMTEAEKLAIAAPANGLTIFQTDGGVGFWYYDGVDNVWRMLSRYLSGEVEMGPSPSTITRGTGYSVTRLADGVDQIDFNIPYADKPSVVLSSDYSPGAAPVLGDYCVPSYTSCNAVNVFNFWLYAGTTAATLELIDNEASGCSGLDDSYIFYPPGDPVYQQPVPDLCLVTNDRYTLRARAGHTTPNALIRIWIDWQQDGFHDQFDDLPVQTAAINWAGNQTYPNLLIPPGAFNGDTFMRVVAAENSPTNSCPGGTNGETEEYQIHISCYSTPVYQDVPTYCNIGEINTNFFRVSCRRVNGEPRNARKYFFQVNENN